MIRCFKLRSPRKTQQGIALIQVLLISAIISILAIRFSLTAREQIETAEAFEDRVNAKLLVESTLSQLLYNLITLNLTDENAAPSGSSEGWNFYGKPFLISNNDNISVVAAIQAHNGLLSQYHVNTPFWKQALSKMGEAKPESLIGKMQDWQDIDKDSWVIGNPEPTELTNSQPYRNMPIQLHQEIDWLMIDNPEYLSAIKEVSTSHAVVGLNLLYSPDSLFRLIFDNELADNLIQMRKAKQLTNTDIMAQLKGNYDTEYVSLVIGTKFRLKVEVIIGEVQLSKTLEVQVEPRKIEPLLIFARY